MSGVGVCVGGLAIQISDARGNLISRNAQEGVLKMSILGSTDEHYLNDADIKVAHAMGIDPKAIAAVKYRHGRRGLSGIPLIALHGVKSPFAPPADDEDDDDSSGMGIRYPDGSTSISKRKKGKS